jgi:hypothetical protein
MLCTVGGDKNLQNEGGAKQRACKTAAARRDRPCQAGRSKRWLNVKNRKHLAMLRDFSVRFSSRVAC